MFKCSRRKRGGAAGPHALRFWARGCDTGEREVRDRAALASSTSTTTLITETNCSKCIAP